MRLKRAGTILVVACYAMIAAAAEAQSPASPKYVGRIVGVYDDRTGNPLDSVEVRDMVTGSSALTTSTGTLSLFFVDTDGSLLRFRKVGYTPMAIVVANAPDLPPLTITLQPIAQTLPAVLTRESAPKWISPGLRGFEARRKTGMGYFVPDSIMRKSESRSLGSLIRSYVPSVNVFEPNGLTTIVTSRREPGCAVDVYLDGMVIASSIGKSALGATQRRKVGDNNLSQYSVYDLAAIEYHNVSDAPPEYSRPGGGCGVLLLWTREK